MYWVLLILGGIFVWLVVNHPLEKDKFDFQDKYSYYLKKFKQNQKKKRKG